MRHNTNIEIETYVILATQTKKLEIEKRRSRQPANKRNGPTRDDPQVAHKWPTTDDPRGPSQTPFARRKVAHDRGALFASKTCIFVSKT